VKVAYNTNTSYTNALLMNINYVTFTLLGNVPSAPVKCLN